MRLVDNWQTILRMAWNVKFNVAAAIFGAGELAVQLWPPTSVRPSPLAGIAAFVSIAVTAAQVMAQNEISDANAKKSSAGLPCWNGWRWGS
jgi:hypothetical protein